MIVRRVAIAVCAVTAFTADAHTLKPPAPTLEERRAVFRDSLETRIGTDINDLIRDVEIPQSQYLMPNGHTIFRFDSSVAAPGPISPIYLQCVIEFEADKNIIVHITIHGCVY